MRRLILLAALLAAPLLPTSMAEARNVYDTHFAGPQNSACFVRDYTKDHLAKHPDQWVRHISLGIAPVASPPGQVVLNVMIALRGENFYLHEFAYCRPDGDAMACALEGDSGGFTITARKSKQILLTVGRNGMLFEGPAGTFPLFSDRGDDRSFLIPSVPAEICN